MESVNEELNLVGVGARKSSRRLARASGAQRDDALIANLESQREEDSSTKAAV